MASKLTKKTHVPVMATGDIEAQNQTKMQIFVISSNDF